MHKMKIPSPEPEEGFSTACLNILNIMQKSIFLLLLALENKKDNLVLKPVLKEIEKCSFRIVS